MKNKAKQQKSDAPVTWGLLSEVRDLKSGEVLWNFKATPKWPISSSKAIS